MATESAQGLSEAPPKLIATHTHTYFINCCVSIFSFSMTSSHSTSSLLYLTYNKTVWWSYKTHKDSLSLTFQWWFSAARCSLLALAPAEMTCVTKQSARINDIRCGEGRAVSLPTLHHHHHQEPSNTQSISPWGPLPTDQGLCPLVQGRKSEGRRWMLWPEYSVKG